MTTKELRLNDKQRGQIWLTIRDGIVVSAVGSDPKRFIGLPEAHARHLARYGAIRTQPKMVPA